MGSDVAQIGVTGDVAAGGLIAGNDGGFRSHVVGDGGANDGNGGGGFLGSDDSRGGIGHDQVNLVVDELGDDGGAGSGFAAGDLNVEGDLVTQLGLQGILEALGSLVKGNVLLQLNDAHGVGVFGFGGGVFGTGGHVHADLDGDGVCDAEDTE